MPRFTLRLTAADNVPADEASSSFYWMHGPRSSFTRSTGPNLEALGTVTALNRDLVHIALAAFAADRSVLRRAGGSDWNQRQFDLEVPVSDTAPWTAAADELAGVLGFLSGDHWTLSFTPEQEEEQQPKTVASRTGPAPQRVVLLSGGADSAIGALYSRSLLAHDEHHILLSHFSHTVLAPIQRQVATQAEQLLPGPGQEHVVVHLGRGSKRIDGTTYPSELSSRSRSLLFLALGLAVASQYEVPLWIPENGFASINPPLGPERLGSLSTRTTHPRFLQDLVTVLTKVGAHAAIENPFVHSTKGEMYRQAASLLGPDPASTYLSATHSCALTGQPAHGAPASQSCGVCFGCVLRRASFTASGIADRTDYLAPSSDRAMQNWLDGKSVEQQVRNFVRRGVRPRDLIALNLPLDYPLHQAQDLCARGIQELWSLYP